RCAGLWPVVHVSYYVGWMLLAIFAPFDAPATRRAGKRRAPRMAASAPDIAPAPRRTPLLAVLAVAIAVSFLNPFGADALRGPIDFLSLRKELLYQGIGELHTIDWSINWQNGLPLLMLAWPALMLWRKRPGVGDLVAADAWLALPTRAVLSQRFLPSWWAV